MLIAVILRVFNDRRIMGGYVNTRWTNLAGITTLVIMTGAVLALLYYQFIA